MTVGSSNDDFDAVFVDVLESVTWVAIDVSVGVASPRSSAMMQGLTCGNLPALGMEGDWMMLVGGWVVIWHVDNVMKFVDED